MDDELKKAKQLALVYLNSKMVKNKEWGELFVSHPFFESAFLADKNGMFNAFNEPKRYKSHLMGWENRINRLESISQILFFIRKSYRIDFIYNLYDIYDFSDEACGKLLRGQWVALENNENQNKKTKKAMEKWLEAIKPLRLESEDDKEEYESLPETFTVYRGIQIGESPIGFSWSLKKSTAIWFAQRFDNENAQICEMEINKKDVVLYTNERKEFEIILIPSKINSQKITITNL